MCATGLLLCLEVLNTKFRGKTAGAAAKNRTCRDHTIMTRFRPLAGSGRTEPPAEPAELRLPRVVSGRRTMDQVKVSSHAHCASDVPRRTLVW